MLVASVKSEPIPKALRAARRKAYAQARTALASPRWRILMLDLVEWLSVGDWRTNPHDPSLCNEPIPCRARFILDRFWRRLKQRGHDLASLDDAARHRVRIEAKKLRYAAEFFDALYAGKTAMRRKNEFGDAIKALQDSLGELNDLVTAPALRAEFGLTDDMPRHARSHKRLLTKATRRFDALISVRSFWH